MTKNASSNRMLCVEVLASKYLFPLVKKHSKLIKTFKGGMVYLMTFLLLFVFFSNSKLNFDNEHSVYDAFISTN